jgi:hypothetical protein
LPFLQVRHLRDSIRALHRERDAVPDAAGLRHFSGRSEMSYPVLLRVAAAVGAQMDMVAGESCHRRDTRRAQEMNRPLFDLSICASPPRCDEGVALRRLNLAGGLLVLLIIALGVVLALIVLAQILLLLVQ